MIIILNYSFCKSSSFGLTSRVISKSSFSFVVTRGMKKIIDKGVESAPKLAETVSNSRPMISPPPRQPINELTNPLPVPNDIKSIKEPKSSLGAFIDKSIGLGRKSNVNQQSSAILTDHSNHVIQGKFSLIKFCNYFKDVPFDKLTSDPYFIFYFKKLCEEDPGIHTRAFQLAIETVFNKRLYLEKDLEGAFSGSFSLMDVVGTNEGYADSSTFYSCLQTDHLVRQPYFRPNIDIRIVISTCLKSDKDSLKALNPTTQQFMINSRNATGNTVNDLMLNEHHYDFKNISKIELNKNHVIFLDFDTINNTATARRYLYNLLTNFDTIIKSNKNASATHYVANAKNKLESILNESSLTVFEKINNWNSFVYSTFNRRPSDVYLPILIPTTTATYNEPKLITNVELPLTKSLEAPDALKALKAL